MTPAPVASFFGPDGLLARVLPVPPARIGLSATRVRIGKLFDGQGSFALAPSLHGGALARIRVPRLAFPKTA